MINEQLNKQIVDSMEYQMKIDAQESYCLNNCCPFFASLEVCPSCDRKIYDHIELEECQTKLITGCPICGYSFCE